MFRFVRNVILAVAILGVALLFVVHFLVLESTARVATMDPPSPQDVRSTKEFYQNLRNESQSDDPSNVQISISADDLASVIKLGARLTPDFRGKVVVGETVIIGDISLPIPWITGQRWLNASGMVPQHQGQFRADGIRIGKLSLPWWLANTLMRTGGNVVVGNGFGDQVFDLPRGIAINDDRVTFDFQMEEVGENNMFRDFFGSMRGDELPTGQKIVEYEEMFNVAMEQGQLPMEGSYLPFLQFLLENVATVSTDDTLADNYTAAIIALAKVCGARDFSLVIGGVAFDENAAPTTASCSELLFNGRIDSRRHFTTAAALQAASNRGFSVTIGEFKELNDTVASGGFDFTDIAANNSGIRLSDVVMSGSVNDLKILLSKIKTENDVIITYDDIPQILSEQDFADRFVDISSAAYKEMLALIEAKIDALPIHQ